MHLEQRSKLIISITKGLLIGLGTGATLFGIFIVLTSYKNGSALNAGALVAIFSGLFCVWGSSKLSQH